MNKKIQRERERERERERLNTSRRREVILKLNLTDRQIV